MRAGCTELALSGANNENLEQKQRSGTSWYARQSAEKKKEILKKQQIARQQKKAAAIHLAEQGKQTYISFFIKKHEKYINKHATWKSLLAETDDTQKNQARRDRERARRAMLTSEDIEAINAQRRARSHILTPNDRQKMLTKRNTKAKARRNTPCAESIAMMCPYAQTSDTSSPSTDTNASPVVEPSASPEATPSACTRNYNTETDGNLSSLLLARSLISSDY